MTNNTQSREGAKQDFEAAVEAVERAAAVVAETRGSKQERKLHIELAICELNKAVLVARAAIDAEAANAKYALSFCAGNAKAAARG